MIILIIFAILLGISLTALAIVYATSGRNGEWDIPALVAMAAIIALVVAGGFAIGAAASEKHDRAYIAMNSEYEVLMYRLENQKDHVIEDTELYNSIVEYNATVRIEQRLVASKWIGIFHDKSIMKCKEIDLSAFSKGVQNGKDKG